MEERCFQTIDLPISRPRALSPYRSSRIGYSVLPLAVDIAANRGADHGAKTVIRRWRAVVHGLLDDVGALHVIGPLHYDAAVVIAAVRVAVMVAKVPCSLQHGLRLNGVVEPLLQAVGCTLTASVEGHLCCGSAGTYSILQPAIAEQLLERKLHNLTADAPQLIATANIGCQLQLAKDSPVPVRHWLEIVADRIGYPRGALSPH